MTAGSRSRATADDGWDLTAAGGLTAGERLTSAADLPLRARPFDLVEHLYGARVVLARRLLWLLGAVIGGGVLMLVTARWTLLETDDVMDFVTTIFSAVMTLVGSAVGFYFGADTRRR